MLVSRLMCFAASMRSGLVCLIILVSNVFGRDGHNLTMAQRMFAGERIRDKKLRGIVISAARSHVFNQIVSKRVLEHGLAKTMHEEVFFTRWQ